MSMYRNGVGPDRDDDEKLARFDELSEAWGEKCAEVERLRELLAEAKPYVTHNGLRIRIWAALGTPERSSRERGQAHHGHAHRA